MRFIITIQLLLLNFLFYSVYPQTITVDAKSEIKSFDHNPAAINLNYLMDDDVYLHPSISLTQSLKNMNIGLVRYPGGEKSDNYLWSVAPYTSAKPKFALSGNCVWPNNDSRFSSDYISPNSSTLDFDEMMSVAQAAGVKPLIVVAGDAQYNTLCPAAPTLNDLITNAVEWVRYANVVKKYGIKYWVIGNESWNSAAYDSKVSTPTQYANDFVAFAKAMKAIDPSISVVANTKSGTWINTLLTVADGYIDAVAISNYPIWGWGSGYDTYRTGTPNFISEVNSVVASIGSKNIKVIVTEYNSIDWAKSWANTNDLGHAIVNFQMFGDQIKIPKVQDAYLWNTRWVDNETSPQSINDALDASGNLNATGKALSLWGNYFLKKLVSTTNSGYVISYATLDSVGDKMNIFLINKDNVSHNTTVNVSNFTNIKSVNHVKFTSTSVNDKNPVITYPKSTVAFNNSSVSLSLDPFSINILALNSQAVVNPLQELQENFPFIVYPNPIINELNIKFIDSITNPTPIRIYTSTGLLVYSSEIEEQFVQIPFEKFPSGIYFLSVSNHKKVLIKK